MIARAEERLLISHFDGSKPQFLTCGSRFQPIEIVVDSFFDEISVNVSLSDEATRMINFLDHDQTSWKSFATSIYATSIRM